MRTVVSSSRSIGGDLARPVEVALAVGRAQAELAVGVQVARRDRQVAGRLDDEQVGLCGRIESSRYVVQRGITT